MSHVDKDLLKNYLIAAFDGGEVDTEIFAGIGEPELAALRDAGLGAFADAIDRYLNKYDEPSAGPHDGSEITMDDGTQILADNGTDSAPGVAFRGLPDRGLSHDPVGLLKLCYPGQLGFPASAVGIGTTGFDLSRNLFLKGGLGSQWVVPNVNTNYTASSIDYAIFFNQPSTPVTLFLPSSPFEGQEIIVAVDGAATANVTVSGNGATLHGTSSVSAGGMVKYKYKASENEWFHLV